MENNTSPSLTLTTAPIYATNVTDIVNGTAVVTQTPQLILVLVTVMKWVYIGIGAVGIVTNMFVIVVVGQSHQLQQQPRTWFILHQSIADLLTSIFILTSPFKNSSATLTGGEGWFVCIFWLANTASNASTIASAYILTAFTLEVYVAIVHPITHKNFVSRRLIFISVAVIWLIAIGVPVSLFGSMSRVVNGLCYINYMPGSKVFITAYTNFVVKMLIPISCYVFSYTRIVLHVRRKSKVRSTATNIPSGKSSTATASSIDKGAMKTSFVKAQKNVAMTLLYTIILHIITWLGNQVFVFMWAYGAALSTTSALGQILQLNVTGCVSPFVYMVKYEKFRAAAKQAYRGLCDRLACNGVQGLDNTKASSRLVTKPVCNSDRH